MTDKQPEFICPHCGELVKGDALACPHCGSDHETGWHPVASENLIEIPTGYADEEDFDYDEFLAEEFPPPGGGNFSSWEKKIGFMLLLVMIILMLLKLF